MNNEELANAWAEQTVNKLLETATLVERDGNVYVAMLKPRNENQTTSLLEKLGLIKNKAQEAKYLRRPQKGQPISEQEIIARIELTPGHPGIISWMEVSEQELSTEFIAKHQDKLVWAILSPRLDEQRIRQFKDKVAWNIISRQPWPENFIQEHKDKWDWRALSQHQILSEDFIREHQDKVHWTGISQYQILSEAFIKEFAHKVNWQRISQFQTLSEKFVDEHKNKVYWAEIARYQQHSEQWTKDKITKGIMPEVAK